MRVGCCSGGGGANDRYVCHGGFIAINSGQHIGRSHGGLTSKIHVVDGNGLPVRFGLTPGEAHDNRLCSPL
jgi:hypothetical protein